MLFHRYASWAQSAPLVLAGLAQNEDWDYRRRASTKTLPILRSYINYTFRRAHYQGRVIEMDLESDRRRACFNTGLLTPHYEPIYGYFVPQARVDLPQSWHLDAFVPESDRRLLGFETLPERATYFDNPGDLLYDSSLDLRINYEHIAGERIDRFPVSLQTDSARRTEALRQAIQHARFRVAQNYKAAIPHYYWPTADPGDSGQLQLLLPMCLEDVSRADVALSVERIGNVYRAATILTLDMAYNNARLIAKPDKEWLEPIGTDRDDDAEPKLSADSWGALAESSPSQEKGV